MYLILWILANLVFGPFGRDKWKMLYLFVLTYCFNMFGDHKFFGNQISCFHMTIEQRSLVGEEVQNDGILLEKKWT